MGAIDKSFELSVIISVIDKFSGTIQKYVNQLNKLKALSAETQASVAQIGTLAKTGGVITAVGAAGATALVKMANAAGTLQTAMMGVQYSMGMTNQQTQQLTNEVMNAGIPTIFSAVQVSGIAAAMARSGLPNYQSIQQLLPLYTNFADVQAQVKHEDPETAAATATTMAHAYQLYNSQQLQPFLETLNAMLLHSNETIDMIGTEWKYTSGVSKLLGQDPESALTTLAFANRLGLGFGRGGQDISEFMQHLIPGAQGGALNITAMEQAGFIRANGTSVFTDQKGNFVGWQQTIQTLSQWADKMNHNADTMLPMLNAMFGQAGGKLAMRLMEPGSAQLYDQTLGQIKNTADINTTQKQLNNTWLGQAKQLKTTLADISATLALNGVMNPLTNVLHVLNSIFSVLLHILQQHPVLDKLIGGFMMLVTAVSLVVGPMLLFTAAWRAWKILQAITGLGKLVEGFIALTRVVGIAKYAMIAFDVAADANPIALLIMAIFAIGAAIGAFAAAWKMDWDNIREKTLSVIHAFEAPFKWLGDQLQKIGLSSGAIFGDAFATGMDRSSSSVQQASSNMAGHVADYLQLHSPAKKGPLSTLDRWWNAFVPTLLSGADDPGAAVGNMMNRVSTASAGASGGASGGVVVQVTFQAGSIVTSDPKQAASSVVNALQGSAGNALGKALQAATRGQGRGVYPSAI